MSSYARNAIVLGLLAAVGPFAIDMYLPALPTIAADLGATTAATQMTLTVFFVGFGLSQLAYGPVTDMVGRNRRSIREAPFPPGRSDAALRKDRVADRVGLLQGIGAASVMVCPAIIRAFTRGVERRAVSTACWSSAFPGDPCAAPGSAYFASAGARFRGVALSQCLRVLIAFCSRNRPKESECAPT